MFNFKASKRMTGRDIHETHRVATPLELLFDLVFVVAVAAVASEFHQALLAHHVLSGLFNYVLGLFALFWAWLNFAWFASAYDTDDTTYRMLTMLQMFGALVMAVGVSKFSLDHTSDIITVLGYVIMRLALASQWIRASLQDPLHQQTCRAYALGIILVQGYWIVRLWFPESWQLLTLLGGFLLEMLVPALAERINNTPWHAHHIAERYSSFTIIVLGECILSTTNAVAAAVNRPEYWGAMGVFGFGALGLIFAIWWLYFEPNWASSLHHFRNKISFIFGYGHFFIYASIAALGASFALTTDQISQYLANHHNTVNDFALATHNTDNRLSNGFVAMCLATALAVFLTAYTVIRWVMLDRYHQPSSRLPLAYLLGMVWLSMVVAVYQFTELDTIWLGWMFMVAPLMMTLVCTNQANFQANFETTKS